MKNSIKREQSQTGLNSAERENFSTSCKQEMKIFSHEMFGEIRTMTNESGETYFVGKDVAEALGYNDPQKAIKMHVDDDDKLIRQIVVSGQNRNCIIISESGLYSLVLSSKLPQAKVFKHFGSAAPNSQDGWLYSYPRCRGSSVVGHGDIGTGSEDSAEDHRGAAQADWRDGSQGGIL